MLKLRASVEVHLSTAIIDMRKSNDTLSILVQEEFKGDVRSGHVFIFLNRTLDKAKLLYWDRNGFVLHYKRLEKHRFVVKKIPGKRHFVLNHLQLQGFLAGLDFQLMGEHENDTLLR